jgi:asparagine synthase (glutamine-hydrolysing)
MCGIAGYCGAEIAGVLERMAECLRHRGPERGGFYHDGAAHFAHRRLSIVDLSVAADQPLTTADGALTVVFNGEIYNHQILRRDLETRGHRFVTDHSDTEVLLHGYREWGATLPEKLDGFWAFVIYDRAAQRIFGSRDRFGKKPFFYAASGADFVFASELTALRAHPALRFSPDPLSLQKYFGYGFIPAPRTIFADIYQLPAGHNFVYEIATGAVRVSEYWDYVIEPQEFTPAQESAKCEELRELLRGAVEKRLRADVPVGILLSGGVDSSSVAALAAQARGEVSTFSIGFAERDFDESPYAAQVAEAIHSKHHLTTMTEREMLGALPILAQIDQPFADDSLLPTYLVCREARKKVTVALGGDGGDELFAGYEPFRYWQWARRLQIYLPKFAPRALAALASLLPAAQGYLSPSLKIKKFFRAAARPLRVWVPSLLAPLAPEEIAELLDAPAPLDEIYAERGREFVWEGSRRQDMIRFGTWTAARDFKAAEADNHTELFPIPSRVKINNPNLQQNNGYTD